MKTVLITGCSSGFGLETARYFLERDWKVIATMRTPREDVLPRSEHLRVLALDVTDPESIRQAVDAAGPIDVLVNNAGIGLLSALEGTSMETAREIFETNTFGTIAMTQAVLPQFRQRKGGVIVNVTSSVTLKPLPLLSVYTASKAAVNAFTESLALELEPFNVRVNLVLPGRAPETRFGENARTRMQAGFPEAYTDFAQRVFQSVFEGEGQTAAVTHSLDVAEAVWRAANDPSCPIRQLLALMLWRWWKHAEPNGTYLSPVIPARRSSTAEGLVKREELHNSEAGHPVPFTRPTTFKALDDQPFGC